MFRSGSACGGDLFAPPEHVLAGRGPRGVDSSTFLYTFNYIYTNYIH